MTSDAHAVVAYVDAGGARHRARRGQPTRLVDVGGHMALPVRVDWHRRPLRMRDVGIVAELADGSEVGATTVAYDTVEHADGQTAVAFRDAFGAHDDTFVTASELRDAVRLADELLRCRRTYNVDRLV